MIGLLINKKQERREVYDEYRAAQGKTSRVGLQALACRSRL
nr:MAG TPA: hypothetical protein [Siphoviridae sp. ctjRi1]